MNPKQRIGKQVAAMVLLLTLVPLASAEEPDETVPLVPPVDESTPESIFVPETCDPLDLVICVGPFNGTVPVGVAVASDGVNLVVWLHEEESEPVGPFQQNVTIPFVGTLPVTLCPNECPVPVPPEADTEGSLTIVVTAMDMACAVTLHADGTTQTEGACPPAFCDAHGQATGDNSTHCDADGSVNQTKLTTVPDLLGEDSDGDGVPGTVDPNDEDSTDPAFWRKECTGEEDEAFYICKMEDGTYKIRISPLGLTIEEVSAPI